MKPSMQNKLNILKARIEELNQELSNSEVTKDMERFKKISKEHSDILPVVNIYEEFIKHTKEINDAKEMLSDPEMKIFAQEVIETGKERLEEIDIQLQALLLPKDPNDEKNIFLEVRAGAGGDESALFAGDVFRMYSRFVERMNWKLEIMSMNEAEVGGYKEVIAKIIGQGAYSKLKFESGGHRVQRVPDTETQGRIHTSACTVAVLPEADEISDVEINPADIRIDTYRASGAGGQHINKTDSAVRITHAPTGIVVECQDDRSQHKNKAQAMSILAAKIKDAQVREQESKIATERKSLIGSGDRSERIRTYNFPQGRITDHRINLTLYKIDFIMDGDLNDLIQALTTEHQADLLAQLDQD
ncbi:MAG: peptide chain release factor 1 [Methylophilales bacterium]|mgnify:CR=1 FL=1|jgi:peptide chain release factor 1|nr:peptide chain release factor 1 [Pseudomonadota bacterium]NQW34227.1 peptide chain release factor 1 [Methylophilales bacterium]HCK04484.1 peptide chain release factor 1 [Methylophilaceae bacterium]|tara:strand:+ start:677 stop:1756 length:1080 start_codon:yes stop_codon:yes gene_type:complete